MTGRILLKKLFKNNRRLRKRSPQRRVFSALFLMVTVVFGVALLVSFLSQFVSPNRIWFAPFLGIPYPYLFVLNALIFLFWLFQWHRYAWVSLLAGLLTMSSMVKYVQCPFAQEVKSEKAFAVLSYNINYFARNDGGDGYSVDSIAHLIRKEKFDIVCLQEFRIEESRFHVDEFEKKISPMKFITSSNDLTSKRRFGTAIFSRYPALNQGYIEFPESANCAVFADIAFSKTQIVRFYCVHFESISFSKSAKRLLSGDALRDTTDTLNLNHTLLGMYRKMRSAYKKRALQVDQLSEHIKSSPYPVVVCGDFNDLPVSYTYNNIRGKLKDPFMSVGHGLMPTFIKAIFPLRIDYILHDPGFEPVEYYSPHVHWSDHYPIALRFNIPSDAV